MREASYFLFLFNETPEINFGVQFSGKGYGLKILVVPFGTCTIPKRHVGISRQVAVDSGDYFFPPTPV